MEEKNENDTFVTKILKLSVKIVYVMVENIGD